MADKYLDESGLSYFWTKIKAYFQEKLISGTNIKTINSQSLLGSGDIQVAPSVTSTDVPTADTISEFDSSAHMNSTDMSAQDVSDFVDGLNVSGGGLVDYIVEQGTSGDTTYRKWNSGIAECWINTTKNVALNNSYGSLYQGTWIWTFPFTFVAEPTVLVGRMTWGTGASWGTVASVSTTNSGLRGIDVVSRASGSTTISAYAKGKWK
jgi:hypothetical protein